MQNKPKSQKYKINATPFTSKVYAKNRSAQRAKNKPKTNPNKPNFRKAKNELKLLFDKGL